MKLTTFNPYKQASGDAALVRNVNRRHWKTMCFGCGNEKPIAGGTFPQKKGKPAQMQKDGILRRFICAECLAKREARKAAESGA